MLRTAFGRGYIPPAAARDRACRCQQQVRPLMRRRHGCATPSGWLAGFFAGGQDQVSSATVTPDASSAPRQVGFAVQGMTCAACAARVEKKLNAIDHVSATVNFATG